MFGTRPSLPFTASRSSLARPVAALGEIWLRRAMIGVSFVVDLLRPLISGRVAGDLFTPRAIATRILLPIDLEWVARLSWHSAALRDLVNPRFLVSRF